VSRRKLLAAVIFAAAVATGTLVDRRSASGPAPATQILVADLHVHPYPGDGSLPVWELRREAERRGIDVIAVTGHNNRLGLALGDFFSFGPSPTIVLAGQEVTTPTFHLVAVGIDQGIDWRLPAEQAIAAVHAQGGVAIAAHPVTSSWRDRDEGALRTLDGAEVAHPATRRTHSAQRDEYLQFFRRVQSVNPDVAPIGSSDFHMWAPLGHCRTYLVVGERSAAGALDALRAGRTVAADPRGQMFGTPEHVEAVEKFLANTSLPQPVTWLERLTALVALLALAGLARPD
jgi:hypothetical protein